MCWIGHEYKWHMWVGVGSIDDHGQMPNLIDPLIDLALHVGERKWS